MDRPDYHRLHGFDVGGMRDRLSSHPFPCHTPATVKHVNPVRFEAAF